MGLKIVGLPLGNAEDISLRMIKSLAEAELVICEDTRVFLKLWQKLLNLELLKAPFSGRLLVLNEFNERDKAEEIGREIRESGKQVILVSDAGMPTISDPGFRLVSTIIKMGVEIEVVPGPTAAMTALVGSGFSADRVFYLGFLPKKQSKRETIWTQINNFGDGLSVIIYEAPMRVKETLEEIQTKLGEVEVVLARELTKEHEEWIRGNITEVISKSERLKGEVVIVLRKN